MFLGRFNTSSAIVNDKIIEIKLGFQLIRCLVGREIELPPIIHNKRLFQLRYNFSEGTGRHAKLKREKGRTEFACFSYTVGDRFILICKLFFFSSGSLFFILRHLSPSLSIHNFFFIMFISFFPSALFAHIWFYLILQFIILMMFFAFIL